MTDVVEVLREATRQIDALKSRIADLEAQLSAQTQAAQDAVARSDAEIARLHQQFDGVPVEDVIAQVQALERSLEA